MSQIQADDSAGVHNQPAGSTVSGGVEASGVSASAPRRAIGGTLLLSLFALEIVVLASAGLLGASLDLRGLPCLLIVAALTATIDAAVAYQWGRWPRKLQIAGRLFGILAVSVTGAALALDVLNRQQGFYASFGDLVGAQPQKAVIVEAPAPTRARMDVLTVDWRRKGLVAALAGRGIVLRVSYFGERSHINRPGYLYLPASYFTGSKSLRFPVIELMHGQPGGPPNVLNQVGAATQLDTEIAAHRLPAVIAVIPTTRTGFNTECVDAVHGQANETYLAVDVPNDVAVALRVLPGRTWAIAGYSTGGFCAVNLALHHPDRYSAAASLSGYFTAGQDPGTARLYGGSKVALRRNSPLWWISHRAPAAPALYLFASRQDSFALAQMTSLQAAIRAHDPALPTGSMVVAHGGHNWNVWRAGLTPALDWLAMYLPMPLAK